MVLAMRKLWVASGCILDTNNTKKFEHVPELIIEDWAQ
jgi:hypothetical protein